MSAHVWDAPVRVRYAETDQMQIVHHANYLVWFELARTELCHQSGLHYSEIERNGYYLVVTQAEVKYRQGARYGDNYDWDYKGNRQPPSSPLL